MLFRHTRVGPGPGDDPATSEHVASLEKGESPFSRLYGCPSEHDGETLLETDGRRTGA